MPYKGLLFDCCFCSLMDGILEVALRCSARRRTVYSCVDVTNSFLILEVSFKIIDLLTMSYWHAADSSSPVLSLYIKPFNCTLGMMGSFFTKLPYSCYSCKFSCCLFRRTENICQYWRGIADSYWCVSWW